MIAPNLYETKSWRSSIFDDILQHKHFLLTDPDAQLHLPTFYRRAGIIHIFRANDMENPSFEIENIYSMLESKWDHPDQSQFGRHISALQYLFHSTTSTIPLTFPLTVDMIHHAYFLLTNRLWTWILFGENEQKLYLQSIVDDFNKSYKTRSEDLFTAIDKSFHLYSSLLSFFHQLPSQMSQSFQSSQKTQESFRILARLMLAYALCALNVIPFAVRIFEIKSVDDLLISILASLHNFTMFVKGQTRNK